MKKPSTDDALTCRWTMASLFSKGTWYDPNQSKTYVGPTWLMDYPAPVDVLPYFIRNVWIFYLNIRAYFWLKMETKEKCFQINQLFRKMHCSKMILQISTVVFLFTCWLIPLVLSSDYSVAKVFFENYPVYIANR